MTAARLFELLVILLRKEKRVVCVSVCVGWIYDRDRLRPKAEPGIKLLFGRVLASRFCILPYPQPLPSHLPFKEDFSIKGYQFLYACWYVSHS